MNQTYEEWCEFVRRPGTISTVMNKDWLLRGCPLCGCKTWQATSDRWAYCDGCFKGFSTYYPFTHELISHLDENGVHCLFCDGYGVRDDGEICEECNGRRTQPEEAA